VRGRPRGEIVGGERGIISLMGDRGDSCEGGDAGEKSAVRDRGDSCAGGRGEESAD